LLDQGRGRGFWQSMQRESNRPTHYHSADQHLPDGHTRSIASACYRQIAAMLSLYFDVLIGRPARLYAMAFMSLSPAAAARLRTDTF
jgi:hypothetical protein